MNNNNNNNNNYKKKDHLSIKTHLLTEQNMHLEKYI